MILWSKGPYTNLFSPKNFLLAFNKEKGVVKGLL
jgi:hypothetical protein